MVYDNWYTVSNLPEKGKKWKYMIIEQLLEKNNKQSQSSQLKRARGHIKKYHRTPL